MAETPAEEPAPEPAAEAVAEESPCRGASSRARRRGGCGESQPSLPPRPPQNGPDEPAAEPAEPSRRGGRSGGRTGAARPAIRAEAEEEAAPAVAAAEAHKKKVAKPAARKPIVRLEKPEHERGRRQERQGTVVSNAMDKTIVVKVDILKAHRKYKKVVRRSTTFHAHDEANQANVGDVVRIVETRPLSKTKRWRLAEIVEAAK